MKIFGFTQEQAGQYRTLSASICWEDSDRPSQEIYFRYGASDAYFLDENYHPFLIAAIIPALRRGERRIHIDGAICPWLKDNLESFMAYMAHWYWYKYDRPINDQPLVSIEAEVCLQQQRPEKRTGAFFSGGVDSLYSLRRNRLNIPLDHPGSVRDAIFVHGFDMGTRPKRGTEDEYFDYVIESMKSFVDEAQLNLIPVFTNLRTLDPYTDCWLDEYMGSAMAAVAHGLSGKLSDVFVASSYEIPKLHPFASHPVLEPRLSSFGLRMHHDGERLSRVERVKLIADWPLALASLRVCFFGKEGQLNCGECPKCIRTKLELLCVGKLREACTMPGKEPSESMVRKGLRLQPDTIQFMSSLIHALKDIGRGDLVRAVRYTQWKYYFSRLMSWKDVVKAIDRIVLKGMLKRKLRLS